MTTRHDSGRKPLTKAEQRKLRARVNKAQLLATKARAAWQLVGETLDAIGSHGHSQCCPVGGMWAGARNGFSGTSPCPCGELATEPFKLGGRSK